MAELVDISEVLLFLGIASTVSDNDLALLVQLKQYVEDEARSFTGWQIDKQTFQEILPNDPFNGSDTWLGDAVEFLTLSQNYSVYSSSVLGSQCNLELCRPYVDVTTIRVWEDRNARSGLNSGFADATELTLGEHFSLVANENVTFDIATKVMGAGSMNKEGIVTRINATWPTRNGTVLVQYDSGFDPATLDAQPYRDIKSAIVEETVDLFKRAKNKEGADGSSGDVESETIGDYNIKYHTDSVQRITSGGSGLGSRTTSILGNYMNWAL